MDNKPGQASLDRMVEAHRDKFEETLVCGIPLTELTPDQLRASLVRAHEALLEQAAHRMDFNMFSERGRD